MCQETRKVNLKILKFYLSCTDQHLRKSEKFMLGGYHSQTFEQLTPVV